MDRLQEQCKFLFKGKFSQQLTWILIFRAKQGFFSAIEKKVSKDNTLSAVCINPYP